MNDVDAADRIGRKRARVITVSAVLFVTTQAISFGGSDAAARPEQLRLGAWIVWAVVLLGLLAGVGGWAQPPGVRALLDDEVTRENRRTSMIVGFWAALAMAAFTWVLGVQLLVTAAEGPRLVITFGVASALFNFAHAERRAYRA